MLYVPLMSEDIHDLLTGILEQAVPLLSLFMGFACSFPTGKRIRFLVKTRCTVSVSDWQSRALRMVCIWG